jgi:hypothetical protein
MNAQPNASSESGTFPLGNLRNRHEMAPLFRIREASLLVHHFDLLVDYLLSKPINRDMHPITLLALHNEVR